MIQSNFDIMIHFLLYKVFRKHTYTLFKDETISSIPKGKLPEKVRLGFVLAILNGRASLLRILTIV